MSDTIGTASRCNKCPCTCYICNKGHNSGRNSAVFGHASYCHLQVMPDGGWQAWRRAIRDEDNSADTFPIVKTEREADEMGMQFRCVNCREVLTEPGALLISPPAPDDTCVKRHLCQPCHDALLILVLRKEIS